MQRLYDLDYESDNIATIQALLLMSHYYPSMTEQKHTWHWIHQAVSLAHVAGLHRDPGNVPHRQLWARVWWACVVRDRLNGLGTGRPLMINSLDCDIPMLTIGDLQELGDDEEESDVKLMFVEFVKLCQYIEGVLSLRHFDLTTAAGPPDQVKVCEDALQRWVNNLPPEARRQEQNMRSAGQFNTATLYRAVVHAAYKYAHFPSSCTMLRSLTFPFSTTVIALHQSYTLLSTPQGRNSESQQKVNFAALDTTQLFLQLVNIDLVKYCPTIW